MVNRREMLAGTLAGAAATALPASAAGAQDRETEVVSLLQRISVLLGAGVGPKL
jgi:hypothetical protein